MSLNKTLTIYQRSLARAYWSQNQLRLDVFVSITRRVPLGKFPLRCFLVGSLPRPGLTRVVIGRVIMGPLYAQHLAELVIC